MNVKIGLVDDHQLFLQSLGMMLASFRGYEVVIQAANGKDMQEKITRQQQLPDIVLIDVNMPVMNGEQTAAWLTEHYPAIKLIALSMKDDDKTIIDMLRAGCCAYMLKDTHPDELERALGEVNIKGYYNGDQVNIDYRRSSLAKEDDIAVSGYEQLFLGYACTDMTYKQIAAVMEVSERTVDNLREAMFEKLQVHSRVGLAMEVLRRKLVP